MPYKPAPPCRKQGCPNLSIDKSGYCTEHKKEAQGQQDSTRGSSTQRGYDRRWRKARVRYLREHPLCVECQEEGRIVAAIDVDHIITAKRDTTLFWDESNWQPLCHHHHSVKTAKEDGAFGNKEKSKEGGGVKKLEPFCL